MNDETMPGGERTGTGAALLGKGLVMFALLLLLGFLLLLPKTQTGTDWSAYATATLADPDGVSQPVELQRYLHVARGEQLVLELKLPVQQKLNNAVLCLCAPGTSLKVLFGEEQIYTATAGAEDGTRDYAIPVPDAAWGGSLRLVLNCAEENALFRITGLELCGAADVPRYSWVQHLWDYYACGIGAVAGLLLLLAALLLRRDVAHRGEAAAAGFLLLLCLWRYTAVGLYGLLSDAAFWPVLARFVIYLLPVPALVFFFRTERRGLRPLLGVLLGLDVVVFFVALVRYASVGDSLLFPWELVVLLVNCLVGLVFVAVRLVRREAWPVPVHVGMGLVTAVGLVSGTVLLVEGLTGASVNRIHGWLIPVAMLAFTTCLVVQYWREPAGAQTGMLDLGRNTDQETTFSAIAELSNNYMYRYDISNGTSTYFFDAQQLLGLPQVLKNVPESVADSGIVSPDSIEAYQQFYQDMKDGQPRAEAVFCIRKQDGEESRWFQAKSRLMQPERGKAPYAICALDDITEDREKELAFDMHRQSIRAMSREKVTYFEFDITHDVCEYAFGNSAQVIMDGADQRWEPMMDYVYAHLVYAEDRQKVEQFLRRESIMDRYHQGQTELWMDYRALDNLGNPKWTRVSISLVTDRYTGSIKAYCNFEDINEQKSAELQLTQNIQELKKELENSRIKVMMNQMQPHFLYNALSAIRTITKRNPDYAYDLLYDFTTHLRSSIRSLSSDAPIPFADELKNIKAYLNIEKMRFGDVLHVVYDIQCEDFEVIPLSIQPLAENAARHGVYPKGSAGGTVTVRTYEVKDYYMVEILDDGIGFNPDAELQKTGDSVGLKNLIFRLDSLMHASVKIDSTLGKGTKVTVSFPKTQKGRAQNENDIGR